MSQKLQCTTAFDISEISFGSSWRHEHNVVLSFQHPVHARIPNDQHWQPLHVLPVAASRLVKSLRTGYIHLLPSQQS